MANHPARTAATRLEPIPAAEIGVRATQSAEKRDRSASFYGIPQSQVSDWENNRYTVLEISTLIKLAKVFHCSVDELLAGVDPDYDVVDENVELLQLAQPA